MDQNNLNLNAENDEISSITNTGSGILEDAEAISEEKTDKNAEIQADLFNDAGISDLKRDFPAVNIENLRKSEDFQAFLGLISKNPTLSQVYSVFNSISQSIEEKSKEKALFALASSKTSPGALSYSEGTDSAYFTKAQVMQMSRDEIRKNLDKIRQSQAKW